MKKILTGKGKSEKFGPFSNNFTFGKFITNGNFLNFLIKKQKTDIYLIFVFYDIFYLFFKTCHFKMKENISRGNKILERIYRELFQPIFEIEKMRYIKVRFNSILNKNKRFFMFEIPKNFFFSKILKYLTVLFSMGLRCCLVYGETRFFLKIHASNTFNLKKINSIKKILKKI